MATTEQPVEVDGDKLMEFVFRAVDEVGATLNAALVVMGDKLGLYRELAGAGGLTPVELARRAGVSERYVREWLNAQAAGGFIEYDPAGGTYTLAPEQAVALTDESSPAYLPGFFQIAVGSVIDSPRTIEAARTGEGTGWHEHNHDVFEGCERFFRPGYNANLVPEWLPALDGVVEKLEAGAKVADLGCGHGVIDDPAWRRRSRTRRSSGPTTTRARSRPPGSGRQDAGVGDRVTFETAYAGSDHGDGFDLVCTFDSLHDMGDPVGAARQIRNMLSDDGTWLIVEPIAGDRVEDNLNPVGRAYYGFSTFLCTPASLSQDVGLALGAQAGQARIGDVVAGGGFSRFRRAAETPFNMVLEARP